MDLLLYIKSDNYESRSGKHEIEPLPYRKVPERIMRASSGLNQAVTDFYKDCKGLHPNAIKTCVMLPDKPTLYPGILFRIPFNICLVKAYLPSNHIPYMALP